MPPKKKTIHHFEKSIDSLEKLVQNLEKGDLPLEDALKQFEQGIQLARECQIALTEAEQKVLILTEQHADSFTTIPFESDDDEEEDDEE